MSSTENLENQSYPAGADLSALQFTAVRFGTGKTVVGATTTTAPLIGILQNKPTTGQAAKVGVKGVAKAIAGGSITAGDKLTATTGGKLITTTTDNHNVIGVAQEDAVLNDLFQVFLTPGVQRGS
jgi:hypothetical protein